MGKIIKITADAGGTKTQWSCWQDRDDTPSYFCTPGINPAIGTDSEIAGAVETIKKEIDARYKDEYSRSLFINYFGAGCKGDSKERLEEIFHTVFSGDMLRCKFHTDLEGAATALFGDEPGLACILGTGSASGVFDGRSVTDSIPSLGYILGDEGSGAFMGRELLNRYFKRALPEAICASLEEYADMGPDGILEKVYRTPNANKFLASLVPFIKANENEGAISTLIDYSLKLFFEKNVLKYKEGFESRIGFVGGVACAFEERLKTLAQSYRLQPVKFLEQPIRALTEYYKTICI